MKLCHRSRSPMCTVTSSSRSHCAETQFCLSFQRCVQYTVIRAEVRPSQSVNKKPHKVWVAVQTDRTMLLSADVTVPYGIISLCVWLPKIYEMYERYCVFGAFL